MPTLIPASSSSFVVSVIAVSALSYCAATSIIASHRFSRTLAGCHFPLVVVVIIVTIMMVIIVIIVVDVLLLSCCRCCRRE
jgi:hypothetical protein